LSGWCQGLRAIDSAAFSVLVGRPPPGGAAAANRLLQASAFTRVTQAASRSASVAKLAMVGVWLLLSGSWMAPPHPPVSTSTKLGTLPAAMRRLSGWPASVVSSRNCAFVHTDATVVISLRTTLEGGFAPRIVISAIAGLLPAPLLAEATPPVATRYRLASGVPVPRITNLPSLSVLLCASCLGVPAPAANSVTVDWVIGRPPPNTWPLMSAANIRVAENRLEITIATSNGCRIAGAGFISLSSRANLSRDLPGPTTDAPNRSDFTSLGNWQL